MNPENKVILTIKFRDLIECVTHLTHVLPDINLESGIVPHDDCKKPCQTNILKVFPPVVQGLGQYKDRKCEFSQEQGKGKERYQLLYSAGFDGQFLFLDVIVKWDDPEECGCFEVAMS
ncbi:unnamed protein product [Allacma fusca]|uniref:Uncharacterized protein n=1 Tax=Allacma fusca TaxID=39272 RepID=A0A8J2P428_9HEXA|nr:unnamed protein product [Allacma fusca]